jgi:hypothetical protein
MVLKMCHSSQVVISPADGLGWVLAVTLNKTATFTPTDYPQGETMKHSELLHRFQNHPIGSTLAHMESPESDEALHCYQIMIMAMAELMAWQGEITNAKRDALQGIATQIVMADVRAH